MLADCYEMGWGVERDENKAKEYHDKAHELQMKELGNEEKQGGVFFVLSETRRKIWQIKIL